MRKLIKKTVSFMLVFTILLSNAVYVRADSNNEQIWNKDGVVISVERQSKWENGFTIKVTISNHTDQVFENWKLRVNISGTIRSIWNAEIVNDEDSIYINNVGWNRNIEPHNNITFGMCIQDSKFENLDFDIMTQERKQNDSEVIFGIVEQWENHAIYNVTIQNNSEKEIIDWILKFEGEMKIENIWNARILSAQDGKFEIGYMNYNEEILDGQSVTFGMQVSFLNNSDAIVPQNITVSSTFDSDESNGNNDLFLLLDGILNENVLNLFWTSSNPADSNGLYLLRGNRLEILEGNITESSYYLDLNKYKENIILYVEENDHYKQKSNVLSLIFENGTYYIDVKDLDGDGFLDVYEQLLGTKMNSCDTDLDGMTDYVEFKSGLNPMYNDADQDLDGDGLPNIKEIEFETNVHNADTDLDGLSDSKELALETDPTCMDSDFDDIMDGTEIELKLDPLNADTNEDGIMDGEDVYTYKQSVEEGVDVKSYIELQVKGSQIDSFSMESIGRDDPILGESIPGYIGEACDLNLQGDFISARLIMEFPEKLIEDDFDPVIYYYNQETQELEEVEKQKTKGNIVSAELEHFSNYILINKTEYAEFWKINRPTFENTSKNLDIIFALDSSGSMRSNDPDNHRKKLSNSFINELGKEDRVAVIDFDSSATILCSLKSDKENAKKAIKAIDSSGNTDIVDALKKSLKVINDNYEDKNKKMVILLTDGKSNTAGYKSICNSLKEKNASVYTIGLGNNVNTSFLKSIASITDGKYYHANEADELNKYFNKIRKEYEGAKDSDGDGICDYYEDNFIIGSGATMKLNKNDPDSDGDGITDGKETKFIRKKKDGSFHSFVVYSLPSEKDSDGDELWDNEDDTKLHAWKAKTGISKIIEKAGFKYSEKDDKIYSKKECWQRKMGYCAAFDFGAELIGFYIDCEAIYFNYDNKLWLAELWKGQYVGEVGTELGFYYKKDGDDKHCLRYHYRAADDDQPIISVRLKKNGKYLLSKGRSEHWWQTGFVFGDYIYAPDSDLETEVRVEFKNKDMLKAFVYGSINKKSRCKGLSKHYVEQGENKGGKKPTYTIESETIVRFTVKQPQSRQPKSKAVAALENRYSNEKIVDAYNAMKREFKLTDNDPNKMPTIAQVKKHCKKDIYKGYNRFINFIGGRERYVNSK